MSRCIQWTGEKAYNGLTVNKRGPSARQHVSYRTFLVKDFRSYEKHGHIGGRYVDKFSSASLELIVLFFTLYVRVRTLLT